jgi:hypothetical protein
LTNPDDGNITDFHESSDYQVMTIRLSSSQSIEIKNLTVNVSITKNCTQKTTGANVMGFDIINKTSDFGFDRFIMSGNLQVGKVAYVKIGRFVRDNRILWPGPDHGVIANGTTYWAEGFALPPGTWYIVVYAGVFDLPNDCINVHSTIDVNIINPPNDLNFSKNEEGKFNGLWFGEFNVPLLYSRCDYREIMTAGKAEFTANDSFLYTVCPPARTGYWRIKWDTPDGIKECKIIKINGIWISKQSNETIFDCMQHVGGSGKYRLFTSYFMTRFGFGFQVVWPIYLCGLYLKLT